MNLFALLLCLLPLEPQDGSIRSNCDAIEVNHYGFKKWDDSSVQTQVVFWDLTPTGPVAVGWKFIWNSQVYLRGDSAHWVDNKSRFISAPIWYETWTEYDPEFVNRCLVPQEKRRRVKALW